MTPADELTRADQGRRALELLGGEQAERVAGDDGGPAPAFPVDESPVENGESHQAEVCLRLPAAGREPDQIDQVAIRRFIKRHRFDGEQEERELEGPPHAGGVIVVASRRKAVGPQFAPAAEIFARVDHLHEHRAIRHGERAADFWMLVGLQQAHATPHPQAGVTDAAQETGRRARQPRLDADRCGLQLLGPGVVLVEKTVEIPDDRRVRIDVAETQQGQHVSGVRQFEADAGDRVAGQVAGTDPADSLASLLLPHTAAAP